MSSNHRHIALSPYRLIALFSLLALLAGCAPTGEPRSVRPGNRYATGFEIVQTDSTILLTIYSPWQSNQVMAEYTITEPYHRLASNACTHVGYIKELNALPSLVGITDRQLVYTPLPDSVVHLGNSMSPDKEQLLLCHPDAFLLSTYSEGDENPKHLSALGIPIIYINEWQETHPLARAEWLRVFGALTGHLPQADSIFQKICENYNSLTTSPSSHLATSPNPTSPHEGGSRGVSILSGQNFRGTWYVPAGHTYMAQLFRDAGYRYRYANDPRTQSIPLTTEQVIREFQDADIWVGVQASSLNQLAQIDNKHTWFRAYQQGHVYNFQKRTTPTGGNDFWETGTVHPERILHDLRLIQPHQPNTLSSDTLFFSQPLP